MYVAGYTFIVLDNAFTNHRGLQFISQRSRWRTKQQEDNNGKVDTFVMELIIRWDKESSLLSTRLPRGLKNLQLQLL